jgi:hypothetical protein
MKETCKHIWRAIFMGPGDRIEGLWDCSKCQEPAPAEVVELLEASLRCV